MTVVRSSEWRASRGRWRDEPISEILVRSAGVPCASAAASCKLAAVAPDLRSTQIRSALGAAGHPDMTSWLGRPTDS
jgi:hypothetical protein